MTERIGAAPHKRTEEHVTLRTGHRERRWNMRLGTLRLHVSKLREGGYVPRFIEHPSQRTRFDQRDPRSGGKGVSTRKVEAVLEQLGIAGVSAGRQRSIFRLGNAILNPTSGVG